MTRQEGQPSADVAAPQPHDQGRLSPSAILSLQGSAGNRTVTDLLGKERTQEPSGGPDKLPTQRGVIDGESESETLWGIHYDEVESKSAPWKDLYVAFTDHAAMVRQNMSVVPGRTMEERGNKFYSQVDESLTRISKAAKELEGGDKYKGPNGTWLKTLSKKVANTRGGARWVQQKFGAYATSTYLEALTKASESRSSSLKTYATSQEPGNWVQPDNQTELLLENREADAARVAKIRQNAKQMLLANKPARDVLNYMSTEAKKFLQEVVAEYVKVAGLEESALAIVTTGSFGSGELFPYSDADVQLMTVPEGEEGRLTPEYMEGIIHNIRMRVRFANMTDSNGKFTNTSAWDVDNLTQNAYDPQTVVENDKIKGMANAGMLHSTARGQHLAGDLAGRYRAQGRKAAKEKMDSDLYGNSVTKGAAWVMKDPSKLDNGAPKFDFKDKFSTLPKVLLNVLSMYHGLTSSGSWTRIADLKKMGVFSSDEAARFNEYLDLTARVRMNYQFFYEQEARDEISPTPGLASAKPNMYPKGYYVLTEDDRKALKQAQKTQAELLVPKVESLNTLMNAEEQIEG